MVKKGEFIIELEAEQLGLSLEKLAIQAEEQLKRDIAEVAHGAHATLAAMAQHGLNSTRNDYLKGLQFEKIGENSYLISLDGEYANKLESGYPAFDMRSKMLQSQKSVEVGPRAGQPWVQHAKDGHKYAHVPFERQPFSKAPRGSDMAQALKSIRAENRATQEWQGITKIFRDANGRAIDSGIGAATQPVARVGAADLSHLDDPVAKKLAGLVKYQRVTRNEKTGRETVQSIYHSYRTVSENSSGWQHPGFKGLHAFDQVEKWVEEQLHKILREYLG